MDRIGKMEGDQALKKLAAPHPPFLCGRHGLVYGSKCRAIKRGQRLFEPVLCWLEAEGKSLEIQILCLK